MGSMLCWLTLTWQKRTWTVQVLRDGERMTLQPAQLILATGILVAQLASVLSSRNA